MPGETRLPHEPEFLVRQIVIQGNGIAIKPQVCVRRRPGPFDNKRIAEIRECNSDEDAGRDRCQLKCELAPAAYRAGNEYRRAQREHEQGNAKININQPVVPPTEQPAGFE